MLKPTMSDEKLGRHILREAAAKSGGGFPPGGNHVVNDKKHMDELGFTMKNDDLTMTHLTIKHGWFKDKP